MVGCRVKGCTVSAAASSNARRCRAALSRSERLSVGLNSRDSRPPRVEAVLMSFSPREGSLMKPGASLL